MSTEGLERAFQSTRAVVANVKTDQLSDSTPCESWDVRALMNHIIGGAYYFAGCANDGKAPPFPEDDFTAGDFVATYDEGIEQALAAFNAPGALDQMIELPFGALPATVWIAIATTDTFQHGWDLARATGQSSDLDPEFAVQLLAGAKAFIQPAFRGADTVAPFGSEKAAPANATRADELAAFLGRSA